jgi:HK97 family phage prohead protease
VLNEASGKTEGCHSTKQAVQKQLRALYANEEDSKEASMRRASTPTVGEDRRDLPLASAEVEIREDGDGAAVFAGYAAKFNSRTLIGALPWGFYEEVSPGAFSKTLGEGDQRKLIQHDPYYVVSRVSAGTLRLSQDKTGLAVDSDLDRALSYVPDLIANVRNKNISGMSFGFRVIKDTWAEEQVGETSDGKPITGELRTIKEAELIEVSSVTFPAYGDTEAGLRATDPVRAVGLALARRDSGLIEARAAYCPELLVWRKAVASHSTTTADGDWDAGTNVGRLPDDATAADLRAVYAWVDPEGDPTSRSSYKLPHHFVDSDGKAGAASTKACSAAIAVLNGGRGGSNIPDADREAVYAHLAKHLKDAGMDVPELKSADATPDLATLYADLRHLIRETVTEQLAQAAPAPATPQTTSDDEPAEATPVEDTTDGDDEAEPAASTPRQAPSIADRMHALQKRYRLPAA